MIYDEKLIDGDLCNQLFGRSILAVLEDGDYVDNLYRSKKNQIMNKDSLFETTYPYDGLDDLRRDYIENFILYLSTNNNLNSRFREIYKMYYNYFYKKFLYQPALIINSRLQKHYKDFFLLNSKGEDKVGKSLEKLDKTALKIYNGIDDLGAPYTNYMLEYFTSRINDADPYIEGINKQLASKILNSNHKYGVYGQKLMIAYAAKEYCKKNNLPEVSIYMTNKSFTSKSPYVLPINKDIVMKGNKEDFAKEIIRILDNYKNYCDTHNVNYKQEINPFTM